MRRAVGTTATRFVSRTFYHVIRVRFRYLYEAIFRRVRKVAKSAYRNLYVRPSPCISSAPIEWIFLKFYIADFN